MKENFRALALAWLVTTLLTSCGEVDTVPHEPGCDTKAGKKSALLAVSDNYVQHLCGCAEKEGTRSTASTPLTCTVDAGTLVVFHFTAQKNRSLIAPVGTPAIPRGPLSDPERRSIAHAFKLDTAGSYEFQDVLNPTIAGTIVVQ